jgi:hypothetical protein
MFLLESGTSYTLDKVPSWELLSHCLRHHNGERPHCISIRLRNTEGDIVNWSAAVRKMANSDETSCITVIGDILNTEFGFSFSFKEIKPDPEVCCLIVHNLPQNDMRKTGKGKGAKP